MPNLLVAALALLIWMVGWCLFYRSRLERLSDIQRHFEASLGARHQNEDDYRWLQRHHHEFLRLVRSAEVADSQLAYMEPIAPTHYVQGLTSAHENWLALRNDSIQHARRSMEQARGVYEARLLASLNPLHWVVMLLTFPMQAVKWIGGNPDGSLSRALTVLWWLVGAAAAVAGLIGFNLLDVLGRE